MIVLRDFNHWKNNTPSKSVLAVILNPNFHCLFWYRIAHWCNKKKLSLISKIIWFNYRSIFSIDLDWRAEIGENFFLVHGIGTVIGAGVKIGDDVKVYQNVTIGGNGKSREYKGNLIYQPIIENGVSIFASSLVLGPILIKENAIIGAGSLVLEDVSQNIIFKQKRIQIVSEGAVVK